MVCGYACVPCGGGVGWGLLIKWCVGVHLVPAGTVTVCERISLFDLFSYISHCEGNLSLDPVEKER